MDYLYIWLIINLPLPLFVFIYCVTHYIDGLQGIAIGILYGFYVFCLMLFPSLIIAAIIKSII